MAVIRDTDKPGAVCYPVTRELYVGARGDLYGQHGNIVPYDTGRTATFKDTGAPYDDGKIYAHGQWAMRPHCVAPRAVRAARWRARGCKSWPPSAHRCARESHSQSRPRRSAQEPLRAWRHCPCALARLSPARGPCRGQRRRSTWWWYTDPDRAPGPNFSPILPRIGRAL